MATTRLMSLHTGKGRNISKAISDIIDYVENPQKTDNGKYIYAYECDSRVADTEFLLSKRQYEAITGREQGKRDVIAYHIRQAFLPGEITPEEANRLGQELARAFTKGNHQFIVATHVDKHHVHNHIIFNSTTLDCSRKFQDFKRSAIAVRRISDRICLENGLSIVEKPKLSKGHYGEWLGDGQPVTWQEKLRQAIDAALDGKPADLDAFLQAMKAAGYEVKQGKYLSFRASDQQRFTRLRSLGEDYSDAAILERIDGKRTVTPKRSRGKQTAATAVTPTEPPPLRLLIDLQNSVKVKNSPGYERWAKVFNLKQLAQTFNYIEDNNLTDLAALDERAAQATAVFNGLSVKIKEAESRMREINELQKYIGNYSKTRDTYARYREAGYSKKFLAAHEADIILHQAAKKYFDGLGMKKLPSVKALQTEYATLQAEKSKLYKSYQAAREDMKTASVAKANASQLLGFDKAQPDKKTERDER